VHRFAVCRRAVAIVALAGLIACGGDSNGGGGSPTTPSGTGPGPSGATVTIGANGAVSPAQVTVSTGQSVTFVNNDTRSHEIASDPHPSHTACPSVNAVGALGAGVTRLTQSFPSTGTCGFHDHNDPDNAALKGTITIR
jgi:plastocyanin